MNLLDTHAHLDAAGGLHALGAPKPTDTAAETVADATGVIAVTNLPRHYQRLHRLRHHRVDWALGLHPGQPHPASALQEFVALLPTCTAVGEVGLDATPTADPNRVPMDRQRNEFDQILRHPETARRMVTIHSRRSVPAVIEHLQTALLRGAILHWFTGTPKQAIKAADTGAYFSINERMRRKTDLIAALPPERVLLETDAPHAAKTPGDLNPAVAAIADTWDTTAENAMAQIISNQKELFANLAVRPGCLDPSTRSR